MYFSRADSVFLSQILDISKWHKSGTGGSIRVFKEAKSIRIKFPKPWAHRPFMEIICCSAGPHLMLETALGGPKKHDLHDPPPNEELLSDVPLALGCSYSLLQRSLVTAQTCSLEHVHVCVRPRNLRRGCGGKAPKKRLMPLEV